MKKYRINEIFYSIQGEGAFTGTPMVFVRFSGCNCKCNFCDTDFSAFTEMTAAEIVSVVETYRPCSRVVFTGGEPTLQLDAELIGMLKHKNFRLHIETNGTMSVPEGLDWVTCSPKDAEIKIQPESVNEIKIVYLGQTDSELNSLRKRFPNTKFFYLQPCSGLNIPETVARVLSLPDWRLSLQTHKLINIP